MNLFDWGVLPWVKLGYWWDLNHPQASEPLPEVEANTLLIFSYDSLRELSVEHGVSIEEEPEDEEVCNEVEEAGDSAEACSDRLHEVVQFTLVVDIGNRDQDVHVLRDLLCLIGGV